MTTAIDSKVIVNLWDSDVALSSVAQTSLDTAFRREALVIAAPVFA